MWKTTFLCAFISYFNNIPPTLWSSKLTTHLSHFFSPMCVGFYQGSQLIRFCEVKTWKYFVGWFSNRQKRKWKTRWWFLSLKLKRLSKKLKSSKKPKALKYLRKFFAYFQNQCTRIFKPGKLCSCSQPVSFSYLISMGFWIFWYRPFYIANNEILGTVFTTFKDLELHGDNTTSCKSRHPVIYNSTTIPCTCSAHVAEIKEQTQTQ